MSGTGPSDEHEIDRWLRHVENEIVRENAQQAKEQGLAARRRAKRQAGRSARLKRRWALTGWGAVAVLLVIVAAAAWSQFQRASTDKALNDTAPITRGAVPKMSTGRPGAEPSADPFAGSPAAHFADGKAGIIPPAARPVSGFSAAHVAAAYRKVKELLVAAQLNPQTLGGGAPGAFARLLTGQQRDYFIGHLDKLGTRHGAQRSTRAWVTSFAPGTTRLIGGTVKVHGRMTAARAVDAGRKVLRISVDYLFVYAVEPPGDPARWMRIVDRNYGYVDFATWDDPGGALEPWLGVWNAGGPAGGRCGIEDGFVHPAFPSGPPDKVQPSGRPINPYDQSVPPSPHRGCQRTTGT